MRVVVLREAGGLGDVIMTEPVVAGLRSAFPRAEIVYVGLPEYRAVVERFAAKPDVYMPVERGERRDRDGPIDAKRWPYLAVTESAARTVDLYCPAFRHERAKGPRVTRSRIELFCQAAGVRPQTPHLSLTDAERGWGRGWLAGKGVRARGGMPIALAPWACNKRRTWKKVHWRELAKRLYSEGAVPVVFHPGLSAVQAVPGIHATGLPIEKALAVLSACGAAMANDSGWLHAAAALDIPCVSVWGSTHPRVTLKHYPRAAWVWDPEAETKPAECQAPCYSLHRFCNRETCAEACAVLNAIAPDRVLAELTALLARGWAGRNMKTERST